MGRVRGCAGGRGMGRLGVGGERSLTSPSRGRDRCTGFSFLSPFLASRPLFHQMSGNSIALWQASAGGQLEIYDENNSAHDCMGKRSCKKKKEKTLSTMFEFTGMFRKRNYSGVKLVSFVFFIGGCIVGYSSFL